MPFNSLLTTSTADLKLVYSIDPVSGGLLVETPLTASGEFALVVGLARLVQDITRWLLTPQGSNPLEPSYGNPLFGVVGHPSDNTTDLFKNMVAMAEADFLQRQQLAASQGFLSLDEQVDHFGPSTVTLGDNILAPIGTALIAFTIYSRAGTSADAIVPFSLTVGV